MLSEGVERKLVVVAAAQAGEAGVALYAPQPLRGQERRVKMLGSTKAVVLVTQEMRRESDSGEPGRRKITC